jgi:uncharacterized protein (TIGR02722 family)
MMNINRIGQLIIVSLIVALSACASSSVKRLESDQEMALTDQWNDTDSKLVAEEMITDMLSYSWLKNYNNPQRERPTVIIQRIRNKSHQHIAIDTFVNEFKRTLIRSGKIDFVVSADEREDLRAERQDQEVHASIQTQTAMAQETGADFALSGTISSIVEEVGRQRVTFYQVDLKLVEMKTNREVWNGEKKIKKLMKRSIFSM